MTRPKPPIKQPFKPTDDERRTVELMCAVGIPHEGIAICVRDGIDDKTLRKHFRKELDTSKIKANTKVAGSVFNAAITGNMTAATLWVKTQMGWRETTVNEHTGKDGKDLIPPLSPMEVARWVAFTLATGEKDKPVGE